MLADKLRAATAAVSYSDITVVTSGSAFGNVTATFGVSPVENDVVFMTVGYNDVDWAAPAGYVEYKNGIITTVYEFRFFYKVMTATPDTGIALGDGNNSSAFTYYILRGVQTESPVLEAQTVISQTSSVGLDPPSVGVFEKCLVLVAGFTGNGSSASLSGAPSGYSGYLGIDADGSADTYIATGYKTIVSGSTEDPGVFTLVNTAAGYASASVVVRPFIASYTNIAPEFVASANTHNTGTGLSLVINKPTGTVEGDLMVAVMAASSNKSVFSGDTGWTEVANQGQVTPELRFAYKVAGASEGASYTFSVTSSMTLSGSILTYRYAAYDTVGTFAPGTDPLILPSISPSESQCILIAAGARGIGSITLGTPTGMTARVTDADAASPSYIICDQTVAKGPTGTRSMFTGSIANVAGILLSIKPTRSL